MRIDLTKDNVNRFHIELMNDDGTPLIPRNGFASLNEAVHAIDIIQMDSAVAQVQDLSLLQTYVG